MRVLTLVPGLDPARGGLAAAATNMVLAARQADVDSVVAAPDPGDTARAFVDELEAAGAKVHTSPTLRWPKEVAYRWGLSPAQAVWAIRNAADFDLIHVHGVWGVGPLTGLAAAAIARKPLVVTAHESLTTFGIDNSRSVFRKRQKKLVKALYLRFTTLFVLMSDLEALESLPPAIPRRTIHLPVVQANAPIPVAPPRGEGSELRVGILGRIDPKKNLDVLIDAMALLPDRVRLTVAGDGPADLVAELRRRADDMGLHDRIDWLGFVEPVHRPRLFGDLDIVAMPSSFEGFGLSAAEAMHHGVPVIVSDRTGIAEVITRHGGGKIVEPNARAVMAAIDEFDRARASLAEIGACGQRAATYELSYDRVGEALREAYANTVRTSSSSRPKL